MKRELWVRLKHYHFDHLVPPHLVDHIAATFGGTDASTRAFASKLARKLGWNTAFALQAIDEYKKFVFLGVVSDFAVTPPKIIDQVWHEHILFSRAYRDFCKEVVERDFDHHPELVATDVQTSVFQAQYAATLELYAEEFNYPPPAEIWGTPKFDASGVKKSTRTPRPKTSRSDRASGDDTTSLYLLVSDAGDDSCHSHHGSAGHHGGHDGGGHDGAHGGGDGGASAGDAGGGGDAGSCGGGSGCSSGCGGGGCSS